MTSSDLLPGLCPTGSLRVVINLGNPVLAQGTPEAPTGVTVDIARELAERLGVELELTTVTAARHAYAALVEGHVDVGFLAIEPAREEGVRFTTPYVGIEGVFATGDTDLTVADVDREGIEIAVRSGSAYDLYLTRTIEHATILRGDEAEDVYEGGADVLAGVRQPVTVYAQQNGLTVLEPAFRAIRQAIAVPRDRPESQVAALTAVVEELKGSGFVAATRERAGQVATIPGS
ncbi:transporter substrate-binding domain-containing protein [Janibacter limosus]|uniref:transporter substrate-binding domain-containing protein n=1 Tax=Janibacter limosus TaxID=53458 RepID=UPI0035D76C6A|nr:transporter substrate-binding domain-containing protein [Janibacter limosus]